MVIIVPSVYSQVRDHFRLHEQQYLELIGEKQPPAETNTSSGHFRRRRRTLNSSDEAQGDEACLSDSIIELEDDTETEDDLIQRSKRRSFDIFTMFAESTDAPTDHHQTALDINILVNNELERYASERIDTSNQSQYEFDVLLWWKNNASKYPLLAALSRFMLAIPASSAPSERLFSVAGSTVTDKRNSLKPSTLNNVLFLRSNYDLIN